MFMKKDLLKKIAQKGYNIGYAANLNFATYDIVKKLPKTFGLLSIVAGILGLVWPEFMSKLVSVVILIMGVASIYIERFASDIDRYGNRGVENTAQLDQLKNLYTEVKGMEEDADFHSIEERYVAIENKFNAGSEPNQIMLSNWYAHFKFFCEKDVSWMDEQLHFGWWKDKIPQTAKVWLLVLVIAIIVYYCIAVPALNEFFRVVFCIDK